MFIRPVTTTRIGTQLNLITINPMNSNFYQNEATRGCISNVSIVRDTVTDNESYVYFMYLCTKHEILLIVDRYKYCHYKKCFT